jgi:heparin/heparan-sulfate lyase
MRGLRITGLLLLLPATTGAADLRWIEVDGIRVVEPPPVHPRLYLRARDLDDVRRRLTHPALEAQWQAIEAAALENTQVRIEVEALRYLLDRDAAAGRRTVAEALELLRKTRPEDAPEANSSRKIGRMMVTGAIAYDWCYPELVDEQKGAFFAEFVRLAGSLECGYPAVKGSGVGGHSSEWMILRDLLSAGIAAFDEHPEMYRIAARRIFGLHVPARNWWYPAHAFHQGPGYADARFASDMFALWIFDRMGAGNVFHPAQQFVPYEWIYLRRPDGGFVRSADGQNWPTRLGSLLCASYYGDGYILASYRKDPQADPANPLYQFFWPDPGHRPPGILDYSLFQLLWSDPDLEPRPIADLPLSRYFGFPHGRMVARTGWDEQGVIAQMRVNLYNFTGHEHNDAGSFELYYKGPLAIHSGVYQGVTGGYNSAHHANYYKRTIAHNSLLIHDPAETFRTGGRTLANDGGQRLPNHWQEPMRLDDLLDEDKGYRTGAVLGQGFGPDRGRPEYTYLKGDITAAYGPKVREVKRSFVFLNLGGSGPSPPAALVVFDRVVAADPASRKTWLLHTIEEPALAGGTATAALTSNGWGGKLVNTTVLPGPDDRRIDKVGGPGREFLVAGTNYPNAARPPDPETGAWRVELSPMRPAEADLFLNVLQVMDRDAGRPLDVEAIGAGGADVAGIRLADRVVVFNPAGTRAATPVSFEVRGEGMMKLLVTDLAAGTWQVWRDGRILIPAVPVSEDAGLADFHGPAGRYTLRR